MTPPPEKQYGYRRDDDGAVVLTIRPDDFTALLIGLGIAAGSASREQEGRLHHWLRLCDRLNYGNPYYAPYTHEPGTKPE